jgi:hypothetical protein
VLTYNTLQNDFSSCRHDTDKLFRSVSLPNSTLEKTGVKLVTYDGHRINPVGTTVLKCTFKKRNYVLKFFVVPNDTQPILSADACTELGAIHQGLPCGLTLRELVREVQRALSGADERPVQRMDQVGCDVLLAVCLVL